MCLLTRSRTDLLLVVQGAAIASILIALPFAPPANGRMLLIPVGAAGAAQLLPATLASGARLIDRGPIPGSLVIEGQRDRVSAKLGPVIIIAAPQSGCGASEPTS